MNRLGPDHLPGGVALPGYDRAAAGIGIVHFGLGAFARAHLAWYTDQAMARAGGDWRIAGVSLRHPVVAEQLNPQDGLYLLAERSADALDAQLIGAVATVVVAPHDRERVVDLIAAPATKLISFTVTEKGYCRAADGTLDPALADRGSVYAFLAAGLARRRAAGRSGVTLLSCDNLAENGHQLRRLLGDYLAGHDPALDDWVTTNCTFPSSMVDRIVPATTAADRDTVAALVGVRDEGVVVTEPFHQWVIEDRFADGRPAWDAAGAQFVASVVPFETAKLRLLNGAHSALAYCGLLSGHAYVHQAVADPELRRLGDALMRDEAAPTVPAAGQDLGAYADALLARFANPALNHGLIQIAMDGSQKIPQRWLATLAANRARGRRCPAILTAIGAWLRHVRGDNVARWGPVVDPRARDLAALWRMHGAAGIVPAVFGVGGPLASDWVPDAADIALIPLGAAATGRAR